MIDGLVMGRSLEEHVGMFGYTRSAVIKNLGLDNASNQGQGKSGWPCGVGRFTSTITGDTMFHEGECGISGKALRVMVGLLGVLWVWPTARRLLIVTVWQASSQALGFRVV